MKTMSIEQIKKRSKDVLNLEPYVESYEHVSFHLPNFTSLLSTQLERCGFPYYFIIPVCNSNYEAFLELVVCIHS